MPEPQVIEPDFFEVIGTQRAMRRLKPDPVPEAYIKKIIWAATRAPSGGNRQGWRWLVVTDPASKKQIQEWYNELWSEATASGYGAGAGLPEDERLSNERVMKSATYLAEHMHEVPVLIFRQFVAQKFFLVVLFVIKRIVVPGLVIMAVFVLFEPAHQRVARGPDPDRLRHERHPAVAPQEHAHAVHVVGVVPAAQ